jgi:uncharacterized lipoprotein YddW (UPF0748 family)
LERRSFLVRAGQTGLALAALPGLQSLLTATDPQRRHWTWVHGDARRTPEEWRDRFAALRESGVKGVLVGGGDLSAVAASARAADLEVHRWIWVLNRSGDSWVKAHHPEWFTVSRSGDSSLEKPPYVGYYQWLCPSRPEVRDYLRNAIGDAARDPAVDGIHLDYIRHSDVILPRGLWEKYGLVQDRELPQFDFCYCQVCRDSFKGQSGVDPLALTDPTTDAAWRRFRWDSVTGLVQGLVDTVHAAGKRISAAVFPTPAIARQLVRQAWDEWPLDLVFPMAYHRFYNKAVAWIGDATRAGVAALPATRPLYTGLYLPDLSPADLATAVNLATEAGAEGVSFFEMSGLTEEHLRRLRLVQRGGM